MNGTQKFVTLDGMRGIAAFFVLVGHTQAFWHFNFPRGYLAVDLFFILSGFVIAHAYEAKLVSGRLSKRGFVITRLIRLYPMYGLSLVLAVSAAVYLSLVRHSSSTDSLRLGLATIFALAVLPFNLHDGTIFPINPPTWSLFFELIVNALYAVFRSLLTTSAILLSMAISFCAMAIDGWHVGNLDFGHYWGLSLFGGLARAVFGILCGLLLFRHREMIVRRLRLKGSVLLPLAAVAVVLGTPEFSTHEWMADLIAVAVVFPLCVLLGAEGTPKRLSRALALLGIASYPIYVLHVPVARVTMALVGGSADRYAPMSGIAFVTAIVVLSLALERFVDLPLRQWLRSVLVISQ